MQLIYQVGFLKIKFYAECNSILLQ